MAAFFNLIRPGYELVTVKLEWNVQVPFLQPDGNGQHSLTSPLFSSQETPNRKWQLQIDDSSGTQIKISLFQYNSWKSLINFVEPVLVRMSIIDIYGQKCLLQILPSERPTWNYHSYTTTTNTTFTFPPSVEFLLSKQEIWQSDCQQSDESLTFYCKILTHVKQETQSSADSSSDAISCLKKSSNQFGEFFDSVQFSDVTFNIRGREFPAHKNILAARSQYFSAMFQHPTKENLTNQIEIEDVEPDVFHELLRFIYTGRVQIDKLETMVVGLFIAADKYLLDELKLKCENHFIRHMSPENCVFLLLNGNLKNPSEVLKKAAKFFRRNPRQVMATDGWKNIKKENPAVWWEITEFLLIKN